MNDKIVTVYRTHTVVHRIILCLRRLRVLSLVSVYYIGTRRFSNLRRIIILYYSNNTACLCTWRVYAYIKYNILIVTDVKDRIERGQRQSPNKVNSFRQTTKPLRRRRLLMDGKLTKCLLMWCFFKRLSWDDDWCGKSLWSFEVDLLKMSLDHNDIILYYTIYGDGCKMH